MIPPFFFTFLLILCLGLADRGHAEESITLWHTLDIKQAQLFSSLIADFEKTKNIKISLETGVEVEAALLAKMERKELPDVVFAPSNLVSLAQKLKFSKIPQSLRTSRVSQATYKTTMFRGGLIGVPIILGNHLILYCNKNLVKSAPSDLEDLGKLIPELSKKGAKPLAMDYHEPYVFSAFANSWQAFPIVGSKTDFTRLKDALPPYKALISGGIVPPDCDYDCPLKRFFVGEFACAINGDWAFAETKERLGSRFMASRLPKLGGKRLISFMGSHALLFPGDSLNGKKRHSLGDLVNFLQSDPIQQRWYREGHRLPVIEPIVKNSLLPRFSSDEIASLEEFRSSLPVPNEEGLPFVWQALRKGLRLYLSGVQDDSESIATMQKLANSRNH